MPIPEVISISGRRRQGAAPTRSPTASSIATSSRTTFSSPAVQRPSPTSASRRRSRRRDVPRRRRPHVARDVARHAGATWRPSRSPAIPIVDHRADIYSLGCVAYEMLTGASPFAGKSPQQMLAAHVIEKPVPIRQKRPDDAAGARRPRRCVAWRRIRRHVRRSATRSRGASTTSHCGIPARSPVATPASRRAARVARSCGDRRPSSYCSAPADVPAYRARSYRTPTTTTLVAVAPFEVLDPQLALWKEGIVDVLSRNLDGAASIRTVSPSAAIKQWEARVGRDEAFAFAKRIGAQLVVYGSLQSAGRDIVDATVWLLDARSASNQPTRSRFAILPRAWIGSPIR